MRFVAVALALIVGLLAPARETVQAQSAAAGQQAHTTPTFRSRADAVWLTAFVTDSNDRPVHGLTVDDFEILEMGQPRDITTFHAVDLPLPAVRETLTGVEADVRTNETAPGRAYVFVVGIADHCLAYRARLYIKEFLTKHFGPDDIGMLVNLTPTLRRRSFEFQNFTRSVRVLSEAADSFTSDYSCGGGGASAIDLGVGFRAVIETLSQMEGRHKTMLLFSTNALFDSIGMRDFVWAPRTQAWDDWRTVLSMTTRADLTIYPIDPRGVTGYGMGSRMALRDMARATGGFAITGTNYASRNFERIAADSSSFYSLGFNSGYMKDDGRFVDVVVRVKRAGLKVRTREGYVPLTRRQRDGDERTPRPASTGVLGALASPIATHAGLPLRVHAVPFRRPNHLAEVALTVETDASAMSFAEKNGVFTARVDLRHLATDALRRLFPEVRGRGEVTLDRAAHTRAGEHGMRFVSVFDVPPGRYQVRVASESGSATGGVVYDLDVPDFDRQPFALSGLALTTARAALAPTALVVNRDAQTPVLCRTSPCTVAKTLDSAWQPYAAASSALTFGKTPKHTLAKELPAPPTTVRQFVPSDVLAFYAEAYDNRPAKKRNADGAMIVMTTIYNAQDAVVHRTVDEGRSPAPASGGSTYPIRSTVPLTAFEAGSYVLEIAIARQDDAEPIVRRSVPFRVR